jgi:pyruvate/2-oxoglutarate dehydrogenase complex dihydrolipoamide dehydrogenase (E3) component
MSEHFDAIVIGMGPGGEVAASNLLRADKRVAVIERELIGGECGYWACIPSKTLLRPPEAQTGVNRAEGVAGAQLDWPSTRDYRDVMIRHLDDSNQVKGYEKAGATVVKGVARITGKGQVEVDGRTLTADNLIIATGTEAFIPTIDGLDGVPVWTNREATTLTEIPKRAVMIGGSAVGVELGIFLRRYGAQVTILERSGRLLSREDPRPGELTEQYLREEGIDVRTGTSAVRAHKDGADTVVDLDSGDEVRCDVIIVGTGRTPGPVTWDWSPSGSSSASAARSWWTTTAGPGTACGRSVTSPASCRSRTWRCTWPASSPATSLARTARPGTTASPVWSSATRRSSRSASPASKHSSKA